MEILVDLDEDFLTKHRVFALHLVDDLVVLGGAVGKGKGAGRIRLWVDLLPVESDEA